MRSSLTNLRSGSSTDLAFAVVVLASYFTTFSSITSISVPNLMAMILLGILYLSLGVYGYAFCLQARSTQLSLSYFAIQIALGALVILLSGQIGYNAMIFLPLVGHSVTLLPEMWRYLMNGLMAAAYGIVLYLIGKTLTSVWTSLPVFVAGQVFILVFTQMAVSEEKAKREIQALAANLSDANKRLREYALQAEELATAKERNRLAREIHDGLGHHLTELNMQIRAASAVLGNDPHKSKSMLKTAEGITQRALVDVRQSVAALRAGFDADRPLELIVKDAMGVCQGAGIVPVVNVVGTPRLMSAPVALTVYRTVQECANNTVKHARAQHLTVTLDFSAASRLHLLVEDDGVGTDRATGGFGLVGIRERVQLLNGEVSIQTQPGAGFRVDIQLADQP